MTMTAKKQTAVMWLREQFHKVPPSQFGNIFDKALQMEREQKKDDYLAGTAQFDNAAYIVNPKTPEQYYADTYGE